MFFIGGFKLDKLRPTLVCLCLLVGLAGLFRMSAMDMQILLSAAILPSFLLEIIGFPLLAYWLRRSL